MPKEKLKNIHQIDFVHFSAKDVVRHPVVAQIIQAYEPVPVKNEEKRERIRSSTLSEGKDSSFIAQSYLNTMFHSISLS